MSSSDNRKNLLITWKEIASYLKVQIRTCNRWEKKFGMPVHRFKDSDRSRVYARKDEIDEWLQNTFSKKSKHSNKNNFQKYKRKNLLTYPFIYIAILTIILIVSFFIIKSNSNIPFDFQINGSKLTILNHKGKIIWLHETHIENLVSDEFYRQRFQFKRKVERYGKIDMDLPFIIIDDINYDSDIEVLFATRDINQIKNGELICFSSKGDILWSFKAEEEMKYGSRVYSSNYWINGFLANDLNNDGTLETVVIFNNSNFFPTRLSVLDCSGKQIGNFWNSGRIIDIEIQDLNYDGIKELIVGGMNNEYNKGCLIVFDSANIEGGSPQFVDKYICKNLVPGTQKYYLLFPRTDVDLNNHLMEAIPIVHILENNRVSVWTKNSNINFEFDSSLNLLNISLSHSFLSDYRKAVKNGNVQSKSKQQYEESLRKGILYHDGKEWVAQHAMSNPVEISENK